MTQTPPQLERPGAGLPFFQNLYLRCYVAPFQSRRNDRDKNLRLFAMVGGRILKEAGGAAADKRDVKVLVPRMPGIEDSSRFWCVNETLEHLILTGSAMRGLVAALAQGKTSEYVVRIEDFKPRGKYAGGDARADFKAFTDETISMLKDLPVVDGGPTHRHPWMGEFNALQWTWLLSGHSGIHLAQLQAIKKGL